MSNRIPPALPKTKEQPKKKINIRKTVIISTVSLIVAIALIWAIVGAVSAAKIINPSRRELTFTDGPVELDMIYETFELTGFRGDDNLVGWWIPAQDYQGEYIESAKTVIMSHNYQSNREMNEIDGLFLAEYLVHEGYNVITFDYTGSGNSKGKNYTFGVDEKDELKLVVDYAFDEHAQKSVALMGFAFGSAAAITEGCADDRISVIIADSPYYDLKTYLATDLAVWSQLPDALFTPYIRALLPVFAGNELDCSPITAVSEASGKSFLFLHGGDDSLFPSENSVNLTQTATQAGNTAEYKIFDGVRHVCGFVEAKNDYIQVLLAFLSENLE